MSSEPMPSRNPEPSDSGANLRGWGIGLIVLGLIGLLLPTFGLQLHRLRMLGDAQWMVLMAAVIAGSAAVLWAERRRLAKGAGILVGGALAAMLLFAWLSFWRHPAENMQNPQGLANQAAGSLPSVNVQFAGMKSPDDFPLLCELMKDCLPTATMANGRLRQSGSGASSKIESTFTIGPVADVAATMREIRFGKAQRQNADTLVVQVAYPLPSRAQAFEKRIAWQLAELRTRDPQRGRKAMQLLESLEPLAQRAEVASELLWWLDQPTPPPGMHQCLAKWATADQVPAVIAHLPREGADVPALLDVLLAVSPDDALREAAALLPQQVSIAERTLLQLGNKSEGAALELANHADPQVREAVCRLLLQFGTAKCLPRLQILANDENVAVADIAKRALEVVQQRVSK